MSNVTTDKIFGVAISYLNNWKPDLIIFCSGLNDARPEGIPESIKSLFAFFLFPINVIEKFFPIFRGFYKKSLILLEHRFFIKLISGYEQDQVYKKYETTKKYFSDSEIFA